MRIIPGDCRFESSQPVRLSLPLSLMLKPTNRRGLCYCRTWSVGLLILCALTWLGSPPVVRAGGPPHNVGTSFTYQGELTQNGELVDNTTCSLHSSLWDDEAGGASVGLNTLPTSTLVEQGRFTITISLGAAEIAADQALWLEIAVCCEPDDCSSFPTNYSTLEPRQRLRPAPVAAALPGLYTSFQGLSFGGIVPPNIIGGHPSNGVSNEFIQGATISGGQLNEIIDSFCTIGGGRNNEAGDLSGDGLVYATVGGGEHNTADGRSATVGGGAYNSARADYATIAGGGPADPAGDPTGTNNRVYDNYGTIGGGAGNIAGSDDGNVGSDEYGTVAGGWDNLASGDAATIGGGTHNIIASSSRATISGGNSNEILAVSAGVIGGGARNKVFDDYGTISGGEDNVAGSDDGDNNSAEYATVGGGQLNMATGRYATVSGGGPANDNDPTTYNRASDDYATVSGGEGNIASDRYATVSGGAGNIASDNHATVGGGSSNSASGGSATVPGGLLCEAGGNWSLAAGRRSKVRNHDPKSPYYSGDWNGDEGTFVWTDSSANEDFVSSGPNQFLIRAAGGVGIGTNDPQADLHVRGTTDLGEVIVTPNQSNSSAQIRLTEDNTALTGTIMRYDGTDNQWQILGLLSGAETSPHMVVGRNTGDVGIGTAAPGAPLHVEEGSPGAVNPHGNSSLALARDAANYVNILAPDESESGVLFGNPGRGNASAGILFNAGSTTNGLQLRTGGNNTRMIIDSDGDVGIGTTSPQAKLHVNGGIRIATTTRYLAIPPFAFMPEDDNLSFSYGNINLGGVNGIWLWGNRDGSGTAVGFGSPVFLPDGARITEVRVLGYDTAPGADLRMTLRRISMDDGSYSTLATNISVGTPGFVGIIDSTISGSVVDNQNYSYELLVEFEEPGSGSLRIGSARISYTINTPLP